MNSSPQFLTLADVFEIHLYQLVHFGGTSGTRDLGLLKSAVAMPEMSFGGVMLHKDIFEMAAAMPCASRPSWAKSCTRPSGCLRAAMC